MQKIRIDFDNPGLPQHISAVENDSQSRFFQATLYENGKVYTAPEGATYSIMYRGFGPQNQGWYDTINDGAGKRAACAVSGNVVTCEIARQALQVPGHVSIVLCVTTGKGYMLKSWPIECDCKNDRYDSTAEIQSFFYITQVSNADWTQAIQAVEELKNIIDPTLSVSGKAADAAKVGEAVGQVKEDLVESLYDFKHYNANTNTFESTDSNICIYFSDEIYLKTLNIRHTGSGVANFSIGHTAEFKDGVIATLGDSKEFTLNTAITINRRMSVGDFIRIGSSEQGKFKFCANKNKTETPFANVCFCYSNGKLDGVTENELRNANAEYYLGFTKFEDVKEEINNLYAKIDLTNRWENKKIVWFGTSIPAGSYDSNNGNRYPDIVGTILGATIYNEAVGSSAISRTLPTYISSNNPYGYDSTDFDFCRRALSDTLEMKEWLINNYNNGYFTTNVPDSMPEDRKELIRNYSYERKVGKYLNGGEIGNVDLYVFDHGYNDYFFNRNNAELTSQYGEDNTYSFYNGMNKILRFIYTKNPNAKIVIISHYTDNATDSIHSTTEHVESLRKNQIEICNKWGIKFIDITRVLGWSGNKVTTTGYWNESGIWINNGGESKEIQIKDMHVKDTVHPYTDSTGESNIRIANLLSILINNEVN